MKALVKTAKGPGNIEYTDIPVPELLSDEVLIKVQAAGICGSDLKIEKDEHPYYPPVVLGHEFSGVIERVGTEVTGWKQGDRVVSELHTKCCGRCRHCLSGQWHVCSHKRAPGWGIDGAFAEFVKMPAWLLHRLPDEIPFEHGAVMEPLAVATHAMLEKSRVLPGDYVVIIGCGPVGLLAAQVARAAGAGEVVLLGTDSDEQLRLPVARELGFSTLNVQKADPVEYVMKATEGVGADLVGEFSGSALAIKQAFSMVKIHGRLLAVGVPGPASVEVPWKDAVFRAVDVQFSFSSKYSSWERALSMLKGGKVDVRPLISSILPLSEWRCGFDLAAQGKAIKVLLRP